MADKVECKCSGVGSDNAGCILTILLAWLAYHGGCSLPDDIKAIRRELEAARPKVV